MRSFARAAATALLLAEGALAAGIALGADQPSPRLRRSAEALAEAEASAKAAAQEAGPGYTQILARERDLRKELDLAPQMRARPPGQASTALLRRVRDTIIRYESLARRFPQNPYSDNALWQGGVLAADAFWQFGDSRDRAEALRLFDRLKTKYPSSSFVARIAGQTARLNGAGRTALSTLKAIRREVLPDALRITLELEREAMFHEERIDGPPRVFVDLLNTQAIEGLKDATVPFPDDVVRQARIGRHPDNRTRVVFDLDAAARHSVYSLYNPYRIVIDFERPKAPPVVPPAAAAANASGGFSLSRQLGLGVSRIVIDPGHGGHDPGARVRGLTEADLVLDVALRLEKLLLKETGADVALTRRTNAYVPLEERTAMANRSAADLFLSIHANASADVNARGFETYFLSFAQNPQAEAIAARENAGSSQTMGSLPDIVKAIAMNSKIDESRDFATMLQVSMYERLRKAGRSVRNLGVKQAPFMVLVGATMPSALTEVSFLTNDDEAGLLRTPGYRQQIAEALFAGVVKYQESLKKAPHVATQ